MFTDSNGNSDADKDLANDGDAIIEEHRAVHQRRKTVAWPTYVYLNVRNSNADKSVRSWVKTPALRS